MNCKIGRKYQALFMWQERGETRIKCGEIIGTVINREKIQVKAFKLTLDQFIDQILEK